MSFSKSLVSGIILSLGWRVTFLKYPTYFLWDFTGHPWAEHWSLWVWFMSKLLLPPVTRDHWKDEIETLSLSPEKDYSLTNIYDSRSAALVFYALIMPLLSWSLLKDIGYGPEMMEQVFSSDWHLIQFCKQWTAMMLIDWLTGRGKIVLFAEK